jgi:hypothetical protein
MKHHVIAAGIKKVTASHVLGHSHSLTDTLCAAKIFFNNNLEALQFSLFYYYYLFKLQMGFYPVSVVQ